MSKIIEEELLHLQKRLESLEQEKSYLIQRQQELLVLQKSNTLNDVKRNTSALSLSEKVRLFSKLFMGRTDVYALRWENKNGRSGYSVACSNEWKPGVCFKPKVKCSECSNRQYKALDEKVLFEHLSGKCIVGLYPLLENNHCWLLAIDLDKADWSESVKAIKQVCSSLSIECLVERSRSGNGAHLWFFFDEPVPAIEARKFGFLLLDKAMEQHAHLSFESYDRLFPNQDLLPDGGFGNLIALPLQRQARQNGNSVFIDDDFLPYSDQWQLLLALKKISRSRVSSLLDSQDKENEVDQDAIELMPWENKLDAKNEAIPGCPEIVTVIQANRVYLPIGNLPQALTTKLKRLAMFSNPVFFKTQALRYSTNGIPRFITLATIEKNFLCLPRGCIDEIVEILNDNSVTIQWDDKRVVGNSLSQISFDGELRKEQVKAVDVMMKYNVGVLHAPTAFGKTVTAIGLINRRKVSTLILVHSKQLLEQWKERLSMFLNGVDIGIIGGGRRKPCRQIDVATYQSLINRKNNTVDNIVLEYGQIIIDECHHLSSPSYERLLSEVHSKYVVGVTATPQRQDGLQPLIFMHAGPIRYAVAQSESQTFEQVIKPTFNEYSPPEELVSEVARPHISKIYHWLVKNKERNDKIIQDIVQVVSEKRNPLVLTERREHALILSELLTDKNISFCILLGGMNSKDRKQTKEKLNEAQVIIATGKYIGEGFDLPRLDTLFLALPISWKGALAQYAGRIHRTFESKEKVVIHDYVDSALPTLQRMYKRRLKGYTALGYSIYDDVQEALI